MNRNSYAKLNDTGCTGNKEKFFVGYAVRGPTIIPGTRQGLPVDHPIAGPVSEPSPLNTRWIYDPYNKSGLVGVG